MGVRLLRLPQLPYDGAVGFYDEEDPEVWARWWVWMWALIFTGLMAAVFFVPFTTWAVVATFSFGIPEGIGLLRHHDPYPPLTYVTRYYLPRWATFTTMYALVGSCGAYWLGFAAPWRVGGIFALLGWLTEHFDTTYAGNREGVLVGRLLRRER